MVPAFFAIAIAALGLSAYSGASSSQGFAPLQPVDFPHPRHVAMLGINCLYCHYAANKSPDPGLPAVGTCMGCHASIGKKTANGVELPKNDLHDARPSPELTKLWEYADIKRSEERRVGKECRSRWSP